MNTNSMSIRQTTSAFCWLVMLVISVGSTPVSAHEFEDGYVERSVCVVIHPDVATLEYSVGCNETTMKALMEKWNPSQKGPVKSSGNESSGNDSPVESVNQSQSGKDAKNATGKESQPLSESELTQQLENQFRDALELQVAKSVLIACDGSPTILKQVSTSASPRHHVIASLKFEFSVPAKEKVHLTVEDNLFQENDGGVRYAAKSTDEVMMTRSNVAPILVRATRYELAELSTIERKKVSKIDCHLAIEVD